MKKITIIIAVGVVLIGGAFYGGWQYGQSKKSADSLTPTTNNNDNNDSLKNGIRNDQGNVITGEILTTDSNSLTIKLRDGSSKIVFYSPATVVENFVSGTTADLEIGKNIIIIGTNNDDGSLTASSIQIRPLTPVSPTASSTTEQSSAVKTFIVTAKNFSFNPTEIRVSQGDRVKIVLNNEDGFHDFKIDEFNAATDKIQGGQQATTEFIADKTGTFEYYCSVGNHRAMGMVGKLIVK